MDCLRCLILNMRMKKTAKCCKSVKEFSRKIRTIYRQCVYRDDIKGLRRNNEDKHVERVGGRGDDKRGW